MYYEKDTALRSSFWWYYQKNKQQKKKKPNQQRQKKPHPDVNSADAKQRSESQLLCCWTETAGHSTPSVTGLLSP